MMIILDRADFDALSQRAQNEIIARWEGSKASASEPPFPAPEMDEKLYAGFDMSFPVDLTYKQVREWMSGASDKTKAGLRVFAEHGPIVDVDQLYAAGVDNISHFQSRVTIRTRTITGDPEAFMFGWKEWTKGDNRQYATGFYAVTPITHQSLRRYFGLD